MPTRITEVEPREGTTRRLRVEGRLTLKEAGLLEGVCEEMREQSEAGLCIDLSAITFLDSESAAVLCRLREQGIALEGLELFVQRMVELAEKR